MVDIGPFAIPYSKCCNPSHFFKRHCAVLARLIHVFWQRSYLEKACLRMYFLLIVFDK